MPIPYDRDASLVSHHPSLVIAGQGGPGDDGVRARLLEAMVQCVADEGYAGATVADVVQAAGVSRAAFAAHFGGKDDCYLEAYRLGMEVLEGQVDDAVLAATEDGWRGRLQDGLRAYLQVLEDDRVFAFAFLVAIHQGSPACADARDALIDRHARRFARAHAAAVRAGEGEGTPPVAVFAVLAEGIDALVGRALRIGEPASLTALEPAVLDAALRVLRGA